MRVKWQSTIKKANATPYQSEVAPIIKKDVVKKGVEYRKARYIVVDGAEQIVSKEIKGEPSIIEETVVMEGSPYKEQLPDKIDKVEFDVDVSELQDYGDVKYYQSEYGKIRVSEDAVYYEG